MKLWGYHSWGLGFEHKLDLHKFMIVQRLTRATVMLKADKGIFALQIDAGREGHKYS
jgi:hypothetical protein